MKAKEKYKQCRIVNTCFIFVAVIGGRLFRNSPKNHKYVHKGKKDLLSVIITLGTNVSGRDKVFIDGVIMYNLVLRVHILKHFNGRCITGHSEKVFHKGNLWRGNGATISFILHRYIFLHIYHHRDVFYNIFLKLNETLLVYSICCHCLCISSFGAFPVFLVSRPIPDCYAKSLIFTPISCAT